MAKQQKSVLKETAVVVAIITTIGLIVAAYWNRPGDTAKAPTPQADIAQAPTPQTGNATASGDKSPAITGGDNKIDIK